MAPPTWTTEEQHSFFVKNLPKYLEYTAQGRQMKFRALFTEEFFSKWPEVPALINQGIFKEDDILINPDGTFKLTESQEAIYKEALETRKKQIITLFRNISTKKKRSGITPMTAPENVKSSNQLFSTSVKKPRLHQHEEIFHTLCKADLSQKIRQAIRVECGVIGLEFCDFNSDESGEDNGNSQEDKDGQFSRKEKMWFKTLKPEDRKAYSGLKMRVTRKVRTEEWSNASDEVKAKVEALREQEKLEFDAVGSSAQVHGLMRSPEERSESIDILIAELMGVCKRIDELTGWCSVVVTGGPDPSLDEKVALKVISYGSSTAGFSFSESYSLFQTGWAEPYLKWLKRKYEDPLCTISSAKPLEGLLSFDKEEMDLTAVSNNERSLSPIPNSSPAPTFEARCQVPVPTPQSAVTAPQSTVTPYPAAPLTTLWDTETQHADHTADFLTRDTEIRQPDNEMPHDLNNGPHESLAEAFRRNHMSTYAHTSVWSDDLLDPALAVAQNFAYLLSNNSKLLVPNQPEQAPNLLLSDLPSVSAAGNVLGAHSDSAVPASPAGFGANHIPVSSAPGSDNNHAGAYTTIISPSTHTASPASNAGLGTHGGVYTTTAPPVTEEVDPASAAGLGAYHIHSSSDPGAHDIHAGAYATTTSPATHTAAPSSGLGAHDIPVSSAPGAHAATVSASVHSSADSGTHDIHAGTHAITSAIGNTESSAHTPTAVGTHVAALTSAAGFSSGTADINPLSIVQHQYTTRPPTNPNNVTHPSTDVDGNDHSSHGSRGGRGGRGGGRGGSRGGRGIRGGRGTRGGRGIRGTRSGASGSRGSQTTVSTSGNEAYINEHGITIYPGETYIHDPHSAETINRHLNSLKSAEKTRQIPQATIVAGNTTTHSGPNGVVFTFKPNPNAASTARRISTSFTSEDGSTTRIKFGPAHPQPAEISSRSSRSSRTIKARLLPDGTEAPKTATADELARREVLLQEKRNKRKAKDDGKVTSKESDDGKKKSKHG